VPVLAPQHLSDGKARGNDGRSANTTTLHDHETTGARAEELLDGTPTTGMNGRQASTQKSSVHSAEPGKEPTLIAALHLDSPAAEMASIRLFRCFGQAWASLAASSWGAMRFWRESFESFEASKSILGSINSTPMS